jgi:hypothetical protein
LGLLSWVQSFEVNTGSTPRGMTRRFRMRVIRVPSCQVDNSPSLQYLKDLVGSQQLINLEVTLRA